MCLNIFFFSALMVTDPVSYHALSQEDRWMENLTAICFFLAGLLLFATAVAEPNVFRRCAYVLGGLAMLFVAGEEISWGQRILGFATPDVLMDVNAQGEFNVHNINLRIFEKIHREGTLILCMVTCAAFFCRKDRLFGIPLPSILLLFGFLLVLSHLPFVRQTTIPDFIHYKEKGLLLLFVIFTLLAGQTKWLSAAVATMALVLALSYASDVSNFYDDRMYEVQEYLFGLVCLFYAGELLRAQGQRVAFRWAPFTGLKLPATFASRRWRFLASRFRGNAGAVRRNGEGWNDEFPRPLWLMMCALVIAGSIGVALLAHCSFKDDAAAVEEAYQRILSGEFGAPAIRSNFDVYLSEDMLIYIKEACTRADRTTRFFLHLIPADKDDLPGHRRRYGFDNLNFNYHWFDWPDTTAGGRCLVAVPLPDYVITNIETGQFNRKGRVWQGQFEIK